MITRGCMAQSICGPRWILCKFIYLFGVLRHFQHCTGHITTGSWEGRENQYIQLVKVLYHKLPTNSKQLHAFPLKVGPENRASISEVGSESVTILYKFIYLFWVYAAFNTVQVISRWVVGRAEETSTYSLSRFCTVNCRPMSSNYQLSHLPGTEPRPQRWEVRVLPL